MVEAITGKSVPTTKTTTASGVAGNIADSSQEAAYKKSQALLNAQPLNPRLVYDKLSGVVITEFLNQSGAVQIQTPSSAVLAYLRVGLGADGRSRQPEVQSAKNQTGEKPDTTFDS